MSNPGLLGQIASKGRHGDTELAHVNPQEAQLLKALGGSETVNPETGLTEYWSLRDQLFGSGSSSGENPIFGKTPIQDQVMDFTGNLWDNYIGESGFFNWASDRLGFGFNMDDGFYAGSHPGDDEPWDAASSTKGGMLTALMDLEKVWKVGKRDYDITKDFQGKKKDAFHKDSLIKYLPQKRTEEWTQGSKGTGVKFGSGTNQPDMAGQYTSEKEAGALGIREDDWKQQQSFASSQFDIQAAGRSIYNNWLTSITSPEYRSQAESWESVTADMPWLEGGSTTSSYG